MRLKAGAKNDEFADKWAERRQADQSENSAEKPESRPRRRLQQTTHAANVRGPVLEQNAARKQEQHGLAQCVIHHMQQRAEHAPVAAEAQSKGDDSCVLDA